MKKVATYRVRIDRASDGRHFASFPALEGCHTQSGTLEDTLAMAKDALAAYLKCLQANGDTIPKDESVSNMTSFDVSMSLNEVYEVQSPEEIEMERSLVRQTVQAAKMGGFVCDRQTRNHFIMRHPITRMIICLPKHGRFVTDVPKKGRTDQLK